MINENSASVTSSTAPKESFFSALSRYRLILLLLVSLLLLIWTLLPAREPAIVATVADSAWVDESAQIEHMGNISRAPFTLPLLPYEPALVDQLIGAHLADSRPLAVIAQIAPRVVFLIHSVDDHNATTPLSGEHQLYMAAKAPKQQWIAPSGGHVGAIKAHTAEYEQRVLSFFAHYFTNTGVQLADAG